MNIRKVLKDSSAYPKFDMLVDKKINKIKKVPYTCTLLIRIVGLSNKIPRAKIIIARKTLDNDALCLDELNIVKKINTIIEIVIK
ncbi:MAG TPA: hypothetical protein GX708_18680 [Gallicola sp.]|nr:hypothetical protein [Gallicola sp.]